MAFSCATLAGILAPGLSLLVLLSLLAVGCRASRSETPAGASKGGAALRDSPVLPEWAGSLRGTVAYACDSDGDLDICLIRLPRTAPTCLLETPDDDFGVTWAPDGKRLAFISGTGSGWRHFLVVADVLKGTARRISTNCAPVPPRWSPDGRWLAFARLQRVVIISPEGTNERGLRFISPKSTVRGVAWTPTNQLLCRGEGRGLSGSPYGLSISDRSVHPLTRAETGDQELSWAPDGSSVAYHTGELPQTGGGGVVVERGPNPNSWLVIRTHAAGQAFAPKFSPDGRLLAFLRGRPGDQGELWVRDLGSGAETELTARGKIEGAPSGSGENVREFVWAPDSRHLACLYRQGEPGTTASDILLLDLSGQRRAWLTRQPTHKRDLTWAP